MLQLMLQLMIAYPGATGTPGGLCDTPAKATSGVSVATGADWSPPSPFDVVSERSALRYTGLYTGLHTGLYTGLEEGSMRIVSACGKLVLMNLFDTRGCVSRDTQ